ncbi:MAG TPA: hypothetical protein IAA98_08995 [Candidatus Avipropionibacterium avicola]|uniref:Uncharacterized protein n=1 Tax=Candidatus Avipropionibacterium avicola TaxID=2840701 RepID=A0A9D1KNV0_9ACTN|nr:hypothetical protein [Candidatus Avipropionibacterium avicola]
MATPWEQVLAAVPGLNSNDAPFTYAVDDGAIIGIWDVAKIETLGLTGSSTFDKGYRIVVRPAGDDKLDVTETSTESETGSGGASMSKSSFKGKQISMSGGFSIGGDGSGGSWSFNDSEIKKPLFDFLKQHGWKKKGLFGGIFG